jgi:hypothetical protein
LLVSLSSADIADDHQPGVDTHAHGKLNAMLLLQSLVERPHCLKDTQAGSNGSLGIILMSRRVAKIDEQTIAKVLGHIALKSLNNVVTGRLVGSDDFP